MTADQQTLWLKVMESDIASFRIVALPLFGLIVLGSAFVMIFALRWIKRRGLKSADALHLASGHSRSETAKS